MDNRQTKTLSFPRGGSWGRQHRFRATQGTGSKEKDPRRVGLPSPLCAPGWAGGPGPASSFRQHQSWRQLHPLLGPQPDAASSKGRGAGKGPGGGTQARRPALRAGASRWSTAQSIRWTFPTLQNQQLEMNKKLPRVAESLGRTFERGSPGPTQRPPSDAPGAPETTQHSSGRRQARQRTHTTGPRPTEVWLPPLGAPLALL